MVRTEDQPFYALREAEVLFLACYLEARSESAQGQLAMMSVVRNRVNAGGWFLDAALVESGLSRWHAVVLKNAFVEARKRHIYQFSCFQDNDLNRKLALQMCASQKATGSWDLNPATGIIDGGSDDVSRGALYFYNPKICRPSWASTMVETVTIGRHRFMKPTV